MLGLEPKRPTDLTSEERYALDEVVAHYANSLEDFPTTFKAKKGAVYHILSGRRKGRLSFFVPFLCLSSCPWAASARQQASLIMTRCTMIAIIYKCNAITLGAHFLQSGAS